MLKKIRTFYAVADAGSFTKASRVLFVSQPAVSQQIAQLEQELGVRLFFREGKTLGLTPEGRFLYQRMRSPIAELESVLADISLAKEHGKQLLLRYHCSSDEFMAAALLRSVKEKYPDISITLEQMGHAAQTLLDVSSGRVDMAFCKKAEIPEGLSVSFVSLFKSCLFGVMPQDHPLSQKNNLGMEDFFETNVVLLGDRDSTTLSREPRGFLRRQGAHNLIRDHHRKPDLLCFAESSACALTLVRAGFGITCLDSLKLTHTADLRCVPLRDNEFHEYGLVFNPTSQNEVVEFVLDLAQRMYARKILCSGGVLKDADEFAKRYDIKTCG